MHDIVGQGTRVSAAVLVAIEAFELEQDDQDEGRVNDCTVSGEEHLPHRGPSSFCRAKPFYTRSRGQSACVSIIVE